MKAILRALVLFLVRGMHPLSMVEDEHFRAFVKAIDPRITLPCRKTLTHSLLPEMYAEAKAKLVTELSLANHIALTADCWTSLTNASYMTVTAHFINDQLKMVSRVLSTLVLEVSHTSENIAAHLKSVIADWDVPEDKISGIVTDNASNFKRAIANILKWKHIPCFAHTLSLAVKDPIHDNREFSVILNKCRNIVTFFHHSGPATLKLNQLCSGRKSRLQQEVPVRWNSTLIMIQSLLALQEPVTDTLKVMDKRDLLLDDWEWETLAGAKALLKPFDILTQDKSSQYYPSISKVLPSIRLLQEHLTEIRNHELNDVLIMMCSALNLNMKDRFVEFYQNSSHIVSSYLNPRFKTEYLSPNHSSVGADFAEKRVVVEMRNLTDLNCQDGHDSVGQHSLSSISSDDIRALHDNRISQLNLNQGGQGRSASANYIIITNEYKKLPLLPWSKDPLEAWRSKQKDGILLPMIPVVKKYACIPATSVPSEQLFSSQTCECPALSLQKCIVFQ
ncbi:Uncharacterized protein APZ42_021473 [Daphnia magna]|uniref:Uncharacterized protein n=1 Tax=Daphnia magna TaxID=35525 RepID=A0A164WMM3_9CRUS|nr:Uncharacterized protein APZ42_021473 [Daphnia magna]